MQFSFYLMLIVTFCLPYTLRLTFLLSTLLCREWMEHTVPLTYVHHCHLLDYEKKLHSVILSHCHYSLKAGQSCETSYNFPLLEKHILDHFILGRPQILVNIPQVVYCSDLYTTATFAAIKNKVRKQVK